jgi:hypothetical protein
MLTFVMRFGTISFLLMACNGRLDTTNTDSRVVHGIAVQHHVTESGIVDQPGTLDLAVDSNQEWLELKLDGERLFLPNDTKAPDVGVYKFGRPDVQLPASKTSVVFDLAGLGAWQPTDSLQIVSPNVGLAMAGPEGGFSASPRNGATTISGQTLDWKANLVLIAV